MYHEISARPTLPHWAYLLPHVYEGDDWRGEGEDYETLFVAKKRLTLPGLRLHLPGGGVFSRHHRKLQLTEPGEGRRIWRLPAWMYPFPNKPPLTYHGDRERWRNDSKGCLLKIVDIGQEFVLNTECYPKASRWLVELFNVAA